MLIFYLSSLSFSFSFEIYRCSVMSHIVNNANFGPARPSLRVEETSQVVDVNATSVFQVFEI